MHQLEALQARAADIANRVTPKPLPNFGSTAPPGSYAARDALADALWAAGPDATKMTCQSIVAGASHLDALAAADIVMQAESQAADHAAVAAHKLAILKRGFVATPNR